MVVSRLARRRAGAGLGHRGVDDLFRNRLRLASSRIDRAGSINSLGRGSKRATGIEPAWPAWKAGTLPLSYARAKKVKCRDASVLPSAFSGARPCYLNRRGLATRTMKIAGPFLLSIWLIVSARADLTIVQKIEAGGQTGEVNVKIKGAKERIDSPSQPTRIIDAKTGEMTDLMNDRKTFVRISAEQMKAAAETITKFNGADKTATKPKLTPTGKKETIGGYETEEYTYETPQFKASFW